MEFILVFEFQLKEMKKKNLQQKKTNLNIINIINLPHTQNCQDDKCAFFLLLLMRFFKNIIPKTKFLENTGRPRF